MNTRKRLIRVMSAVITLVMVLGIMCGHIQTLKANESDVNGARINKTYVGTETLNNFFDVIQDMTAEEFEEIFCSEEYEKDFYNTYEKVKRGDNKLVALIKKLSNLRDEQIDKLASVVYERIPKAIAEKYEITVESISKPLKWIATNTINVQSTTTTTISVLLKAFTGFPKILSKPMLDIVFNITEKIIDKFIDKDDEIEPTATDVAKETENPLQNDILNCPPQLEETNEPFLEDCPPRVEETEQPTVVPIETEIPAVTY